MKFFSKLKNKSGITLAEVLVAIVLTSIILLSMTRLVVVVLRNTTENETYDKAILQFSTSEENFKSMLLAPDTTTANGKIFVQNFCGMVDGDFVNVLNPYNTAMTTVPKLTSANQISIPPSASDPDNQIRYGATNPDGLVVGIKITKAPTDPTSGGELVADSYVYWKINGKENNLSNTIYLYVSNTCTVL